MGIYGRRRRLIEGWWVGFARVGFVVDVWFPGLFVGTVAVLLSAALVALMPPSAAAAGIPDPCTAIPGIEVASALHLKQPPAAALATVNATQTCSFAGGKLTVSVGYSVLADPEPPLLTVNVPGLPHGRYMTYDGTAQTQIVFYLGSPASGVYGVIRNYATITKTPLEQIAKSLASAIASSSGSTSSVGDQLMPTTGG